MQFLKKLLNSSQVSSDKCSPGPSLSGSVIMFTDSSECFSTDSATEINQWNISDSSRSLLSVENNDNSDLKSCDPPLGVSSDDRKENDEFNYSDRARGSSFDRRENMDERLSDRRQSFSFDERKSINENDELNLADRNHRLSFDRRESTNDNDRLNRPDLPQRLSFDRRESINENDELNLPDRPQRLSFLRRKNTNENDILNRPHRPKRLSFARRKSTNENDRLNRLDQPQRLSFDRRESINESNELNLPDRPQRLSFLRRKSTNGNDILNRPHRPKRSSFAKRKSKHENDRLNLPDRPKRSTFSRRKSTNENESLNFYDRPQRLSFDKRKSMNEYERFNFPDRSQRLSFDKRKSMNEDDGFNFPDRHQSLSFDKSKSMNGNDRFLSGYYPDENGKGSEIKKTVWTKKFKCLDPKKLKKWKVVEKSQKGKKSKIVQAQIPKQCKKVKDCIKAEPKGMTDTQKLKAKKKAIDRKKEKESKCMQENWQNSKTSQQIGKDIREFQEKVLQCIASKEEEGEERDTCEQPETLVVDEYKPEPGTQGFCESLLDFLWCMLQILMRILSRVGEAMEKAMNVFATACYNCASMCQQLVHIMPICCIACYYKNRCLRTCSIFSTIQSAILSLIFIAIFFFIIKITILAALMTIIGYEKTTELEKELNNSTQPAPKQRSGMDNFDVWDLPREIPTPADFADWDTSDKQEEDDMSTETDTKHEVSTSANDEDIVVEYDSKPSKLHLADIPVYDSTYNDRILAKKVVNARHKLLDSLMTDDKSTSSEKHNLLDRLQDILKNKPRSNEQSLAKTSYASKTGLFRTGDFIVFKTLAGQHKKATFFEPMYRKNVMTETLRRLGSVSIPAEERYFRTLWDVPSESYSETEATIASTVTNPVLVAPSLHEFGD